MPKKTDENTPPPGDQKHVPDDNSIRVNELPELGKPTDLTGSQVAEAIKNQKSKKS